MWDPSRQESQSTPFGKEIVKCRNKPSQDPERPCLLVCDLESGLQLKTHRHFVVTGNFFGDPCNSNMSGNILLMTIAIPGKKISVREQKELSSQAGKKLLGQSRYRLLEQDME